MIANEHNLYLTQVIKTSILVPGKSSKHNILTGEKNCFKLSSLPFVVNTLECNASVSLCCN